MSMNMVDKVRQHCEMIPDFCVHQIIECVSDQVGTGPEVTAKRVEARGSYVMVALNFLLMDQIYPPDVAYCFVPFLARELCKLTLPEDSDFKPLENVNHIYLVVEDGVSSIRHGKQEEETNIKFKRGIHGLLSETAPNRNRRAFFGIHGIQRLFFVVNFRATLTG